MPKDGGQGSMSVHIINFLAPPLPRCSQAEQEIQFKSSVGS